MDLGKMMKQAAKMQSAMKAAQDKLGEIAVTAKAGGGMVEVSANGKLEITGVTIKPEVVDPDDVEMLEEMVLGAVREAQRLAQERQQEEMSKIAGGLGLPPGMLG